MIDNRDTLKLSLLAFLLCVPSGAALLAKVYGLAEMYLTVPLLVLPSCVGLAAVWAAARRAGDAGLVVTLRLGLAGGLVGAVTYDLYRWPFALAGYRVFVPIQVYGLWTLDARACSHWTDVCGVAVHAVNSLTFSMAYFLACHISGRRHWVLALCYAMGLETLAVVTPFATIFHLTGNVPALLIAYSGHVAWGLPLAWMTARWDAAGRLLSGIQAASIPRRLLVPAALLLCVCIVASAPDYLRGRPRGVELRGGRIEPGIVRVTRGEVLPVFNAGGQSAELSLQGQTPLTVGGQQEVGVAASDAGVFQLKVQSDLRVRSAFVVVEPAAEAK